MSRKQKGGVTKKAIANGEVEAPAAKRRVPWILAAFALVASGALAVLAKTSASRSRSVESTVVVPDPDTASLEAPVVEILAKSRDGVLKSPRSADAWGWYAAVLDAHDFYRHAETAYRRAIELAPEDKRFPYNLAVVLESLGAESDEIIGLYRGFARREPKFPPVHFRIGLVLARKGDLAAAAEEHRAALALDPKLTIARRALGQALLALDDAARAAVELEKTASEAPRDGPTQAALAQTYARLGRVEEAAAAARQARELGETLTVPDPVRFLVTAQGRSSQLASARAANRIQEGDYAGAVADLEIVARARPSDPSVHARLADAYEHLGKRELAQKHRAEAQKHRAEVRKHQGER